MAYRINEIDEQDDMPPRFMIRLSAYRRWQKMMSLFQNNHPHLDITQGGEVWKQHEDGSITISVRGTTLSMLIQEGEWSCGDEE